MESDTHYNFEELDQKPHRLSWWQRSLIICLTIAAGLFLALLVSIISLRWLSPPFTGFTLREDWQGCAGEGERGVG